MALSVGQVRKPPITEKALEGLTIACARVAADGSSSWTDEEKEQFLAAGKWLSDMWGYRQKVGLIRGPSGDFKCPKCGNSMQNGTPADRPDCRRCATCKHVWQVEEKVMEFNQTNTNKGNVNNAISAEGEVHQVVLSNLEKELLESLKDLLPYAAKEIERLNALMVGSLYPAINIRKIERAEAVIAKAEGKK